jgi:DNA (cytosine-5)-methyltransferase 1
MKPLTFLSLFSGIGGIDLGLERAGMRCVGQVEIDPYCRKVLAKHWPDVRQFSDVRELVTWMQPARRLPLHLRERQREIREWSVNIDLIAGGFPCQDISNAGQRRGIGGAKSGLWSEFRRLIGTIRPRVVLVENVAALLTRGLDRVLGDLAACGYDAEWECLPALAFGAPHIRDRVFIAGTNTDGDRRSARYGRIDRTAKGEGAIRNGSEHLRSHLADTDFLGCAQSGAKLVEDGRSVPVGVGALPDSCCTRLAASEQATVFRARRGSEGGAIAKCDWWAAEPNVGRMAHGVPARVDRLRGLGNAVVPQVAEWIGRRIVESQNAGTA